MNIALFGGKFDPPHLDHLRLVSQTLKLGFIHEVWIIPAKSHPWRKIQAPASLRLEMLATFKTPRVKILDLELKRNKPTRTIDTVKILQKKFPRHRFFWILGEDNLKTFHLWKDPVKLMQLVDFIVFARPKNALSSTKIRHALFLGQSVQNLVPKKIIPFLKYYRPAVLPVEK